MSTNPESNDRDAGCASGRVTPLRAPRRYFDLASNAANRWRNAGDRSDAS